MRYIPNYFTERAEQVYRCLDAWKPSMEEHDVIAVVILGPGPGPEVAALQVPCCCIASVY